ncbi:MAG TPA: FtsW/RodA/SpoVE family cell cycle protein, partial [Thermoanaerobaculia bacterium]|nr:FtsW/RodA/SpoVE family cell cycle protein [Thermoanaerobaculia bacterium]
EAALLAAAAAMVLFGLVLAYLAAARSIADDDARRAAGAAVNLNAVRRPEELARVLAGMGDSPERAFIADRIWQRLQQGRIDNVGELGRIRVPAAEVRDDPRLTGLAARLAERPRAATVPLLSGDELRALEDRLVVRTAAEFRSTVWLWTALVVAAFAAVHLIWRRGRFAGDQLLLPLLLVLSGLGLTIMLAVRDPLRDLVLVRTSAQGVIAGCALLLAASLVDFERSRLARLTYAPLFAAVGVSLLLVVFGSGPAGSDAKVNLLGVQPVEVIKILFVLFLAGYFVERWEFLRELRERRAGLGWLPRRLAPPKLEYALPPLVAIAVVLFFFFLQKDLGPALILALLFLVLYAVARGRATLAVAGVAVLVVAFWIGYQIGYPRNVTGRIGMWTSPWDNPFRGGDHLAQSLWSVAGGGLAGTGPGLGEPGRVPAAHTDFVLAAAGEELGFLGLAAIFAFYAVLVARGLRAALRAGGAYGFFLALGATLLLGVQVVLIAGGVFGVVPLTGVVTPFLSAGRSAMLANFLLVGILLAVSARRGEAAATAPFRRPLRWVALALALPAGAVAARAAQLQLVRADETLVRGALVLQADGRRRFVYNPRLMAVAETLPRGAILDRQGKPLAAGSTAADRQYPLAGRAFHLLGDLRNRLNWAASNTTFAERDAAARLQGWDDFAAVLDVEQPDGTTTPVVRRDYRELVPLLRHRYRPQSEAVQRLLRRDRTLRLTIDARLQTAAGDVLARHARQAGHGAAAVVLDARSGELLASVSYPWPRRLPAEPSDDPASGVLDRARYGIYPPGSIFKMVTAMAALRKDPAVPGVVFECVPLGGGRVGNRVRGWGRAIRDDPIVTTPHGRVSLEKGIRQSCNAYFAQLGTYEVGAEPLLETARLLGISVARPNTPEQLRDALPQAAYGQGQVVATPLQMARVAAAVANAGTAPEARWTLDESVPPRGDAVPVVPPEAAALLARAMREVVTSGTAARFLGGIQPPMAGKTGTAEVQGKRSHSWFIGFAPYGIASPAVRTVAVAVIVEHGGYGGRLAAPAAGEIVRAAAALGLLRRSAAEAAVPPGAKAFAPGSNQ